MFLISLKTAAQRFLNMPDKMEKGAKQKTVQTISVLVPEKGSFPYFLRCAVELAKMLQYSVRILVSSRFISERPHKDGFYREYLEEQTFQSGICWDIKIFENPLPEVLFQLSPSEDIVVVVKEEGPLLLNVLLRETSCPTLVIPKNFHRRFQKVVLAYAGGRFSDRALKIAAGLGKHGGCCVEVLTVGISQSPALRVAHERAKYYLGMYKIKADYRMHKGQISKTILKTCEAGQADLLILGASETKEWKDHRFRSLSQEIADAAHCPVLVVK